MSNLRGLLTTEIDRLAQTFPRDKYAEPANLRGTLERFVEGLDGISVEVIPSAVTRAIRECEYWPSPAALRVLCVEEQTRRARETRRRSPDPMICGVHTCGCRIGYYVLADNRDAPPRLLPAHVARDQRLIGAEWTATNDGWCRDDDPDTLHYLTDPPRTPTTETPDR